MQQPTTLVHVFNYISLIILLYVLLQKAQSIDSVCGDAEVGSKKKTLDYRRCVLLCVVGATPIESPSLEHILDIGFLGVVKSWLDDILSNTEGTFTFRLFKDTLMDGLQS